MREAECWTTTTLGNIADLSFGATPSRNIPQFWADPPNGIRWASIADLRQDPVIETAEMISLAGARAISARCVPAGTPLMSFKLTIGRVAIAGEDLYTNEAIVAVTGNRE
jgi:type I restriction enzyme S subunit